MKFEDIQHLFDAGIVAGPASEQDIESAERSLSVKFPGSYRKFLSIYGAALCSGFEIAGVFAAWRGNEPPMWSDVVAATRQKRRGSRGLIPADYVAISDDGGDYTFYLNTATRDSAAECPVVAVGPGIEDPAVVAADFAEFVLRRSEDSLSF